jgi:hypothetical protein
VVALDEQHVDESRRRVRSSGVSFSTTIPAATGWVQAAWVRPFTRTVQIRQPP